jgi:hypothetical protein
VRHFVCRDAMMFGRYVWQIGTFHEALFFKHSLSGI